MVRSESDIKMTRLKKCRALPRLELSSMGLIDESTPEILMHRAVGCAHCGHRGYLGRMAVHKVTVLDDQLKSLS